MYLCLLSIHFLFIRLTLVLPGIKIGILCLKKNLQKNIYFLHYKNRSMAMFIFDVLFCSLPFVLLIALLLLSSV